MAQVSSEKRLGDHVCCLREEVYHLHKLFDGPLSLMHKVLLLENLSPEWKRTPMLLTIEQENKFTVRKGQPGSFEYGMIR